MEFGLLLKEDIVNLNGCIAKFGAFVLPSLLEKQYTRRFNEEFIERYRRALERFINRLARYPLFDIQIY